MGRKEESGGGTGLEDRGGGLKGDERIKRGRRSMEPVEG